jgi:hypothetical protein
MSIQAVCVFCGSSLGQNPAYSQAANSLGKELAQKKLTLIYGGSSVGLMGNLADSALRHGGKVVGIMPKALIKREIDHEGLTEFIEVDSMHARKALMAQRADGFVVLPGGFGTYEEAFEIITWAILGIHSKPIVFLNVEGYFDPFLALIRHSSQQGFIRPEDAGLIRVTDQVKEVIPLLEAPSAPEFRPKWMNLDQS